MTYRLQEWPEARLRRFTNLWADPIWTIAAIEKSAWMNAQ
jgi:hypothetical protein